jgi:hypothetical protein
MKPPDFRGLAALALTFLWTCAVAEEASLPSETLPVSAGASRAELTQRLDAKARECEQKFEVTRCLNQVRSERLVEEGKLNRQEAALNSAQRLQRGEEQREQSRAKREAHAEKLAQLQAAPQEPAVQPKTAAQPTAPASTLRAAKTSQDILSAEERVAYAKDYAQKQASAVAKRADIAKRTREAGKPKSSLPKPD